MGEVTDVKAERANTWLLMAAVFVVSLQILLILSVLASYLPSTYTWEVADVFSHGRKTFIHKYDLPLYRTWIITVMGLTVTAFFIFKNRLRSYALKNHLSFFVMTTGFWLLLGYWAALELVFYPLPWLKVLLAFSILGNLLTWALWKVRTDLLLSLKQSIANISGKLKNCQWFEYLITAGNSKALFLRLSLVVTAVLLALNRQYLFAHLSLPYFLPLRFALVGVFTASFALPLIYMAIALGALEGKRIRGASSKAPWYLILAGCGLTYFLIYIRFPVPSNLCLPLWTGGVLLIFALIDILSSGFRKSWERLKKVVTPVMGVSFLGGIQAGLVCVWIQERIKTAVLPADFSTIVYAAFVLGSGLIYGVLTIPAVISRFSKHTGHLFAFIVFQGVLTALSALAWFKLVIYDYRGDLARWWFAVLGALILLQSIIWPLFCSITKKIGWLWERLDDRLRAVLSWGGSLFFVFGTNYVPNIAAMTAFIFYGEEMNHTDVFVMGPAWAVAHGAVVDVDSFSQYGIGSVYFFAWLMKLLGGVSYVNLFTVLVGGCTVYFILVYVFCRLLLKNNLLALACWMMAFKAQIAFELAFPIAFTYPNSTAARVWPDIIWMLLMLGYMERGSVWYLALASVAAGTALWYVPSTGFYLIFAHVLMVGMTAWGNPRWRERLVSIFWPIALVGTSAIFLFLVILKGYFFSPVFWHNAVDYIRFIILTNVVPLKDALVERKFLHTIVFCLIIFVYMFTLVKVGWDFLKDAPKTAQRRKDLLAFGLSVYGLGLQEYHLVFSMGNLFYSRSVPFFIVLFYWIGRGMKSFRGQTRQRTSIALAGFAFIALVTNHSYMNYPNMFNISSNPLLDTRVARPLPGGGAYFLHQFRGRIPASQQLPLNDLGNTDETLLTERDFNGPDDLIRRYRQDQADLDQDALLIRSLTAPTEKVALISSYEISFLMEADRGPLFFRFPLAISRPLTLRCLPPNDNITTKPELQKLIRQIQETKPTYVFMEKVMSRDDIPAVYDETIPGMMGLLRYVKLNYLPYKEGKYLVAFKRKE